MKYIAHYDGADQREDAVFANSLRDAHRLAAERCPDGYQLRGITGAIEPAGGYAHELPEDAAP